MLLKRLAELLIIAVAVMLAGRAYEPVPLSERPATDDEQPVEVEQQEENYELELVEVNNAAFSAILPRGWDVDYIGDPEHFGFVCSDPSDPTRCIFYFNILGPFKTSADADADADGDNLPALASATPALLFTLFSDIADSADMSERLAEFPRLDNFRTVESDVHNSPLIIGASAMVRGTFECENQLCDGQFFSVISNWSLDRTDTELVALQTVGITAAAADFPYLREQLAAALASFSLSDEYAADVAAGLGNACADCAPDMQTLAGYDYIFNDGWEMRDVTQDEHILELARQMQADQE